MDLTIAVIFSIVVAYSNGQSGDNVKSLIYKLFTENDYNKNVRPNLDQSSPMLVDVDLVLIGINEIDEIGGKLTTTGYLFVNWLDEYLEWDPASYGGLDKLYIPQSDIWKPDIALQNGFSNIRELGDSFITAHILSTGTVLWIPTEIFETKCSIDITYFPFDRQSCNITFVVWTSSVLDIKVRQGGNGIQLRNFDIDGSWTVVSTNSSADIQDFESTVTYTLVLDRNPDYYVNHVIIPIILLAVLSVLTFVIPADSGEKMGYSITVFLSFAVFLTIVSDELPKTPGSILGNYLVFQLGLGTFVIIVTALELRFHHSRSKVPEAIVKLFTCRCRNTKKLYSVSEPEGDQEKIDWSGVVSILDIILFLTTLIIEIIVTAVVYKILSTQYK